MKSIIVDILKHRTSILTVLSSLSKTILHTVSAYLFPEIVKTQTFFETLKNFFSLPNLRWIWRLKRRNNPLKLFRISFGQIIESSIRNLLNFNVTSPNVQNSTMWQRKIVEQVSGSKLLSSNSRWIQLWKKFFNALRKFLRIFKFVV